MVIRHSNQLLEQLTKLEETIQLLEKLMDNLGINGEREDLIKKLLTRRQMSPGQQNLKLENVV